MADIVDSKTRSRMMAGIKGKNTKPEMFVRRFLHGNGFRFRLHSPGLPGKPDLVLAKYHACVFVHGCYWHRHPGCRLAYEPKSRKDFWNTKFTQNVERDRRKIAQLREAGWRVAIIWECAIREGADLEPLIDWLGSDVPTLELPVPKR